jgi:hypothetical protein
MKLAMIKTENVTVYANFDSGHYTNSFAIFGDKINDMNLTFKEFDDLSVMFASCVDAYLKKKEYFKDKEVKSDDKQ